MFYNVDVCIKQNDKVKHSDLPEEAREQVYALRKKYIIKAQTRERNKHKIVLFHAHFYHLSLTGRHFVNK